MQRPQVLQFIGFQAKGQITAANAESFYLNLQQEIQRSVQSVFLVDMSEVAFLDSAGLMSVIKAFRFAQSRNQRFVICSMSAPVRIIFELVRLNEHIEIYESYQDFEVNLLVVA